MSTTDKPIDPNSSSDEQAIQLLISQLEAQEAGIQPPSPTDSCLNALDSDTRLDFEEALRLLPGAVPGEAITPAGAVGTEGEPFPTVPGYLILAEIGRGGMGIVYRAKDSTLQRVVALKVTRNDPERQKDLKSRFEKETRVSAKLLHSGIPPIHKNGTLPDGRPYLEMTLADGPTLDKLLTSRRSTGDDLPGFLGILVKVSQTIAYAHSIGVINLDLKPAHIVVDKFGSIYVLDWGVAIDTTTDRGARTSRQHPDVKGSPAYLSPEQARGNSDLLDKRCDVFGLGAILCEILTGSPPWAKETADECLAMAHNGEIGPAIARLESCGAGAELVNLAKACLQVEPQKRPDGAAAVARNISEYLALVEERVSREKAEKEAEKSLRHEAELREAAEKESREAAEKSRAAAIARAASEERARQEAELREAAEKKARQAAEDSQEAAAKSEWDQRRFKWASIVVAALLLVMLVGGAAFFAERRVRDQHRREQDQQKREQADSLLRTAEALLTTKPELARDRTNDVKTLVGNEAALAEHRRRADDLSKRAQEIIDHQDEVRKVPPEFLSKLDEAEFHILGSLWTLMPHEDPTGRRRIRRGPKSGSNLTTGIEFCKEALSHYKLPNNPEVLDDLPRRGYEVHLVERLRARAAEGLFLLALAAERSQQGADQETLSAARVRAIQLLDLSEKIGNRTKSLYQERAKFLRLLARNDAAGRDQDAGNRLEPETFLDHHLLAGEAHRAGKWVAAEKEYQAALALRPQDYWTLFRLAKVKEFLGEPDQAVGLYQSCVSLRKNDPTAYNNRGELQHRLGRWKEAVPDFLRAIGVDPDYFAAVHNLMLALAELKDVDEAQKIRESYRHGRKLHPSEDAELLCDLGIAYERSGKLDDALKYYTEARERDAAFVSALRNRGNLMIHFRRFDEGEEDLKKAIALEPKNGELPYILGNLYAAAERTEEAIRAYDRAFEVNPKLANAAYNRGVLLRRLKRYKDALASQNAVLSLRTSDKLMSMALHERALNLANLKDLRAALEDLNRILARNPVDVPALLTRGQVRADLERDLEGSEQDLNMVIRLSPKSPDGYRARGITRSRAENWSGAIADYRCYLELRPDAPDAEGIHNDISNALLSLGKVVEAEKEFDLIANVSSPSVLTNRGNLALKKGEIERAVADFDTAIHRTPDHTRAWALRGQARLRQGRFEEAASDFDKALELEPGVYETLLFDGLAHYYCKKADASRESLTIVVQDRPQHVRGRMAQGLLQLLDAGNAQAVTDLSSAVDDEILRPFALGLRARAWLKIGGPGLNQALSDADLYIKALPKDGFAHFEAARIVCSVARQMDKPKVADLHERALDLLEGACKYQPEIRKKLAIDAELNGLQEHPRYKKLVSTGGKGPS